MNLAKTLHTIFGSITGTTGLSQEERTRFQHFSLFLLFGIPLMLVFGIINLSRGIFWVSALSTLSACGLAFGWLLIKYSKKGIIVYRVNAVLYMLLLAYMMSYGGESGSKILWMYTFPLIAFFLFGRSEGAIWSGITISIILFLFFSPEYFGNRYQYHSEFKVRFLASYLTVNGVTFWLEYLRHSYSTRLEAQNRALNDEIVERKKIEKEREQLMIEVQSANRAKSEFLANMSHEIRTPLNGVIGMTSMLLDTKLDKHQKHYANTLLTSGEFLRTIINDILDVSKIEAGKFELNIRPFSLHELLDRFINIVTRKIYKSNVELVVWADPVIPSYLSGDADRLQQILLNLTSNALKFTPEGNVTVTVSTREESPSHITLLFSVKDTGIGIAAEDQSKLFNSFSQIDTPTTREYCGTGLGLNISKQLCEQMDGEVGVSSTIGEGSEFWFVARLEKSTQTTAEETPAPDLQGKSALVATKNKMLGEMLRQHLVFWGATVQCAPTVQPLIQTLREAHDSHCHGDLLIIDQACFTASPKNSLKWLQESIHPGKHRVILLQEENEQFREVAQAAANHVVMLKKPVRYGELRTSCAGKEMRDAGLPPVSVSTDENVGSDRKSWHDFHILLAEDNPINREVLVGLLAKLGLKRVDTVDNGLDVLSALKRKTYHLILMDVSMPKMDGLTVTNTIRTSTFSANSSLLPIIALTAHAIAGDRERCIQAGMNDYLTKPIKPQELMDKLSMWLKSPKDTPARAPEATVYDQSANNNNNLLQFDYNSLLNRMLGDEQLVLEFLNLFLTDVPDQLEQLERHINNRDLVKAGRLAHKLAGGTANLSINRMHVITRDIERHCSGHNTEDLDELLSKLLYEFREVQNTIRQLLQ